MGGTGPRQPPRSERDCVKWRRQNGRRKRALKLTERKPQRKRARRRRRRRRRRQRQQTKQERPASPQRSSILKRCGQSIKKRQATNTKSWTNQKKKRSRGKKKKGLIFGEASSEQLGLRSGRP